MVMMKCQFHWWRKPGYPEETTDFRQVTGQLSHIRHVPSPSTEPGPQRSEARSSKASNLEWSFAKKRINLCSRIVEDWRRQTKKDPQTKI